MATPRKSFYQRLPEIYHIKDGEQSPPDQLRAYLDIMDDINARVRDNVEQLYHDFFIETCDDWVIPYIADLLGTSHLSGDPHDLRADVARTVHHRRRKGTLGAIESLTFSLTGWAAHTVEFFERVSWNQHLNHQRPDRGGQPPIPINIEQLQHISGAVRGGTVNLRDAALLSFLNGPFDSFAHLVDTKPLELGQQRINLPNLGIFLWRLQDYTLPVIKPQALLQPVPAAVADIVTGSNPASHVIEMDIHPLQQPMVLFNTHRYDPNAEPPNLTHPDAVPGPMPRARLTQDSVSGNPQAYVALDFFDTSFPGAPGEDHVGLVIHIPVEFEINANSLFGGWRIRGANLCAWTQGINPALQENEIVIDSEHGRLLVGLDGAGLGNAAMTRLLDGLYVSPTYAFSGSSLGSVGAQPIARENAPLSALRIDFETDQNGAPAPNGSALISVLASLDTLAEPRVIEIQDSRTYDLDIATVAGVGSDGVRRFLTPRRSLTIRAASGQRPIIRLIRPLAFRPDVISVATQGEMENLNVTLEGLYITWDQTSAEFGPTTALIEQAALNQLNIVSCTLDPGNQRTLDDVRQPVRYAFEFPNDFRITDAAEQDAFEQIPHINIQRSICGPMAVAENYKLSLIDSIVDAQVEPGIDPAPLTVHDPVNPETDWGPDLEVDGMTCFGRMRVTSANGQGGIWTQRLEVHDNQNGCIKFSYFSGDADRLPQHQACVYGSLTYLAFVSRTFGEAAYAQLDICSDRKILEQGPERDAMGAFGFLLNTHKWKNLNIRYREFVPVGVNPVIIPVT